MISHSNCSFLMDWEPAESYDMDMDVDVTEAPFSFADCDVYMAPISVQEVHMTSPILTSQPPTISEITLFLPPLEMKTKPIIFPPFNIHAVSRQVLEPLVGPRKVNAAPLDDSSFVYMPAVSTDQAELPTMFSASSQDDTYTSTVHNHIHFPPNAVYRPVPPSPSKYRTTLRDVSPILIPVKPIDIHDEEGQITNTRGATPSPLIESTSSTRWPNGMAGSGDIASNVNCIPWPDSIYEQDVSPNTRHLVVAETNTPEWIDEQDVTPRTPRFVVNTPEWIYEQDVTPRTPRFVVKTPEWIDEQDVTPRTPRFVVNTPEWIDEQDVTPRTPRFVVNTPEWIDEQDVTPRTPRFVINTPEWIDEQDFTPRTPRFVVNTPNWIDERDVTPSTLYPVVAETNTPEWTVDEDVTPLSQGPILETATPFHWPEITSLKEYVDWEVDLIDLWSPNLDSPNFDMDDTVLRAFGVSSLDDLDWILEGFRATSVADACIESKNALNSFEGMFVPAPLHNFSLAVSEAGPDLISFDSAHDLRHNVHSGSFKLSSFESADVIQFFEPTGLFQTSTPAPYNRSAFEESPDVQSHFPFDSLVKFSKAAYTVERNTPRNTKRDASTQTEELPGATYGLRSPRRYSPYVKYSPYRKLSRDFTFGSSGSGDLESAQPTIPCCKSCGLPSPVDNVFLDSSIQASNISERDLEVKPAVRVNLRELEEDNQEKEMTFPGAYPIEQVAYGLDEPAKLPAGHFVKVARKNHFETEVLPCPILHPPAQYVFKELFFRFFTYFFDW